MNDVLDFITCRQRFLFKYKTLRDVKEIDVEYVEAILSKVKNMIEEKEWERVLLPAPEDIDDYEED